MKLKSLFPLLFLIGFASSYTQTPFNKKVFYEILAGNDLKEIDAQLILLEKQNSYTAHQGALLMKKSGLLTKPSEKLELFKTGRNKLEEAIQKDNKSAELRFLRLIIQENSPKILHYDQEINQDALYLRENYTQLQAVVKDALYDFSKKSKVLQPSDFRSIKHD